MGFVLKSLSLVENLLRRGNVIRLATKYDAKFIIILSMIYFERLNPTTVNAFVVVVTINVVGEEFE